MNQSEVFKAVQGIETVAQIARAMLKIGRDPGVVLGFMRTGVLMELSNAGDGLNAVGGLKFKRVVQELPLMPHYATAGAACFDIAALHGGRVPVGQSAAFSTGLAFEVPPGFVLMIYSRSGHGFRHGLRLVNGTGVIDSDYRGEVKVMLHNDGQEGYTVTAGERIAQAMLVPAPQVQLVEVDVLSETARGAAGFGSTGKV